MNSWINVTCMYVCMYVCMLSYANCTSGLHVYNLKGSPTYNVHWVLYKKRLYQMFRRFTQIYFQNVFTNSKDFVGALYKNYGQVLFSPSSGALSVSDVDVLEYV